MALTMLKLIGVELAPIAWIALTIYADVNGAEQVAGSRQGFLLQPISHDLGREGGMECECVSVCVCVCVRERDACVFEREMFSRERKTGASKGALNPDS